MTRGDTSLVMRIVVWLLFMLAAAVVSFFVGYLIGPYVIDRFL